MVSTKRWIGAATAAGLVACAVALGSAAVSRADDDEKKASAFGGTIKVLQWDPKEWIGSFKHEKDYYAFKVTEATRVRVDKPVAAGNWQALNKEAPQIWALAEKSPYQNPSRTVGRLKPRLVLCAGFAIEPVPSGEREFPGVIGILGWHTATEMDWKKTGTGTVDGALYDIGTSPDEQIIFGTEGKPTDIKKGLKLHVLGPVGVEQYFLSASGKLLDQEEAKDSKQTVLRAPLIHADRVVVLHKQFAKVYPLCFEETFMEGAK